MSASITVDFQANIARFSSAIDRATNDLNKFQSNAERVSGNISKAFGALGVGLSVAGLVAFVKSAVDAADHLNDLSASTSLTVTQLSGLQLAAKQTGTDLDGIAASVNKLSVNMGKDGEKFRQLGITAKDPLKAFQQLADVFVGIKDPQERAAVAAAALGKQWAVAAPLLSQGGEAIGNMVAKGIALSGTTEEMAKRADALNDKLDEMHQKTQGLITNALTPLLPMMLEVANYFSDTGDKAKSAGENFKVLTIAFQAIAVVGANVGYTFNVIGMHLTRIVEQTNALAHGDFKGFTEIGRAVGDGIKQAQIELDAFTARILNPASDQGKAKPSSVQTSESQIKNFLGGNGAGGKKTDPYKLQNEAWVREKEFQIAALKQFYDELEKMDNEMRQSALEAQRLIADIDPVYKATLAWEKLSKMVDKGFMTAAQAGKIYAKEFGKSTDMMTEFAKKAAANIQDAFAQFLFDPFKGGLSGMLAGFEVMLRKMAAEAVAANLLQAIGVPGITGGGAWGNGAGVSDWFSGLFGGGGGGGGVAANAGSIDLSYMGLPGFASGTDYVPRDMVARIHQGEKIIPAAQNQGGGSINITVNVASGTPETVRRAAGQGAREALSAFNMAGRYA